MPISYHFRDCKALLVTRLTHVSGAITSVQTFYYQFLQVHRVDQALILLGLAPCLPSTSVSSIFIVLYRYLFFCLHPSLYLLVSWAWWDWPLTWLTDHRSSVPWHCWLDHLTRKIFSEMTYNALSGTLNPTIPYHTCWPRCYIQQNFCLLFGGRSLPSVSTFSALSHFNQCLLNNISLTS